MPRSVRPSPLPRAFFARPSPVVARELLGCWLCRRLGHRTLRVRVVETEAYLGAGDPASHAFRGRTERNAPMFGVAGVAYVYLIYGMHHCFNVVTGADRDPQAVLLRGAAGSGVEASLRLRGPALLCRALSIDLSCNGIDLCGPGRGLIWFEGSQSPPVQVLTTARVGVRDQSPMRFAVPDGGEGPVPGIQRERAPKGSLID
ncbi:MAG: DNA-3-methyladenine glycosylase [Candidatus Dormibacteria bacterium]